MKPISVVADYHRTPFGTWTATIDALFDPDDDEGVSATVAGKTLKTCQDRVMEQIGELSNTHNAPCATLHTIDGNPIKFVQEYTTEIGFGSWSSIN